MWNKTHDLFFVMVASFWLLVQVYFLMLRGSSLNSKSSRTDLKRPMSPLFGLELLLSSALPLPEWIAAKT
jgi:hypothetical protein